MKFVLYNYVTQQTHECFKKYQRGNLFKLYKTFDKVS